MLRAAIFTFILSISMASAALSQTCPPLPYNLINGSSADANQVMDNLNAIRSCINNTGAPLKGYIGGIIISNGAAPTIINFSSGMATSDDGSTLIVIPNSASKNINANWSNGADAGCLDVGTAPSINSWYNIFVIERSDTGATDQLCSLSLSPAMPVNYTKKRRVGSVRISGSGQIVPFKQFENEFIYTNGAFGDAPGTSFGTTAQLINLTIPPNVSASALIRAVFSGTGTGQAVILVSSTAELDVAPNTPNGNYTTITTLPNASAVTLNIRTSGSPQVRVRSTIANTQIWMATYGYIDGRGQGD